jgi:hypothetical protein
MKNTSNTDFYSSRPSPSGGFASPDFIKKSVLNLKVKVTAREKDIPALAQENVKFFNQNNKNNNGETWQIIHQIQRYFLS